MSGHGMRRRTSRTLWALLLAVLVALAGAAPAAHAAISIGNVSVTESNGDGVVAWFTVTRTVGPLAGNVTIAFSTSDGTARAPGDYLSTAGSLFFGSSLLGGEQTRAVAVTIAGDTLDEAAETFRVLLSGSSEIMDGEGATGTILDDDDAPLPPPPPAPAPPPPPAPAAPPSPDPAGEHPAPAGEPAEAGAPAATRPTASGDTATVQPLGLSSPRLRRPSIVLVTVFCPRPAPRCAGRVTIFSRANPRSKLAALRRERRLGQRNFTLLSGQTRTLTIALARRDRVLLMRTGRMLARAYAVTRDGSGRSSVRRSTGTLIARTSHS